MMIDLTERGLSVQGEHPVNVLYRGQTVGEFYADLFMEGKVIVELKAVKESAPEHEAQVINYPKATGIDVWLLIDFGHPRLEYRRFIRTRKLRMDAQDKQN